MNDVLIPNYRIMLGHTLLVDSAFSETPVAPSPQKCTRNPCLPRLTDKTTTRTPHELRLPARRRQVVHSFLSKRPLTLPFRWFHNIAQIVCVALKLSYFWGFLRGCLVSHQLFPHHKGHCEKSNTETHTTTLKPALISTAAFPAHQAKQSCSPHSTMTAAVSDCASGPLCSDQSTERDGR